MIFIFLFFLRLIINYLDFMIIIEWILIRVNSVNMEVFIYLDWISLLFIRFIFLISSIIMIYSYIYIYREKFIERFIYLVILFIISIILMIISPNIIRILFGWDGLGLTSYCLVIYYQNFISYNSGIVTVLCNRVGDVGLLIGIGLIVIKGRWSYWILRIDKLLVFIILVAGVSKRAQIPFSTWLPIAMAAPTPVSALVHSSTLVTAGVYLIIRFNRFLVGREMNLYLLFMAVVTIFMSGLIANVENDLKKIIALSTLRQLGLIIIILRVGIKIVAFYHLLTHAIFKSILFICAGIIIHSIMNNQDIRLLGNLNKVIPFTIIRFLISRLALCGFPFIAGFYSKDFIIEEMYILMNNRSLIVLILISLIFTVSYSVRLYYYMFFFNIKFYSYYDLKENSLINLSIIILVIIRIFVGSILRWLFFYDLYGAYLIMNLKLITLGICMCGLIIGMVLVLTNFLKKIYYLNFFMGSIWYINYLYLWVYNPLNVVGVKIIETDVSWFEYLGKDSLKYIIHYFQIKFRYKIYIFIYLFINIFIWVYLFF